MPATVTLDAAAVAAALVARGVAVDAPHNAFAVAEVRSLCAETSEFSPVAAAVAATAKTRLAPAFALASGSAMVAVAALALAVEAARLAAVFLPRYLPISYVVPLSALAAVWVA